MKIAHKSNVDERRRKEYPPIQDQLDAIWKGGAAAAAMKQLVDAVKLKYPKTPQ